MGAGAVGAAPFWCSGEAEAAGVGVRTGAVSRGGGGDVGVS